jgi:hypothetical protein
MGHVLVPAAAISSLSLLLTAGLGVLGILPRVNVAVAKIVAQGQVAVSFPKTLPDWVVGGATVAFAFGISCAILSVAGGWRRLLLWISAMVLIAGWAAVLGLAAHAPDIGAPFIAVLWSGVCALVYAKNHRMAADENLFTESHEAC